MTAFALAELRTPSLSTDHGFTSSNQVYDKTLERWGLYKGATIRSPVRAPMCVHVPQARDAVMYAFSYTVPAPHPAYVGASSRPRWRGEVQWRHVPASASCG